MKCVRCRPPRVVGRNRAGFGDIPHVMSPLLEEVRVSLRLLQDNRKGVILYVGPFALDRRPYRFPCGLFWEGTDLWITKEPLGVRFRLAR